MAAVLLGAVVLPVEAAPARLPDVLSAPESPALPESSRWGDFVPASDAALLLTQPDGTQVRAQMTDAEIGGELESDGYTITKGDDGWWRYASARSGSELVPSDARAGVDAVPAGLEPGIGRTESLWSDGEGGDVRSQMLRQLQVASREASAQAAAEGGPRVFRFPVVLFATWYDPEIGQSSPQFQEGNTVEHYQAILDGFGGNPTGTLTEFYFENSYGQFLVEVDVLAQPDGSPYVSNRSSVPGDEGRCYYGGIDAPEDPADDLDPLDYVIGAGGGGALGMAVEAMNTTTLPVDHDFAKYDNDGDGSIDFMGIIHSGAEMAVTGDPCNTWSHAISVSTFTTIAGAVLQDQGLPVPDTGMKAGLPVPGQAVTYDRLFTMPEFETRHGTLTIGVAAHEMAHALGEPDYYGTDGSSSGSGDWDIMSGGSYGGTPSGSNPTWFNPATRVFQGWVTPTIVHGDQRGVTLEHRSSQPAGYTVAKANPNLLLVPTRWANVGDTTKLDESDPESAEHTWTENDVYGLAKDGDKGYVIEGFYLEFAGRMPVREPAIHEKMTRESYFDRWLYGSGLLTWHFDYWRQSNVLHGDNGANNDPNRMQMDVEEWDFNDNTQEIALNENRAEASDVAWDAATGITSGTHRPNPKVTLVDGEPQADQDIPPGPVTPATPYEYDFTVEDNPANRNLRVTVAGVGDCTLQLLHDGKPETEVVDAGFVGTPETATVTNPAPGAWTAVVSDFAACLQASGTIEFVGQSGFDATGTADTFSNWDQQPTGWAFTNIRTGASEGISHGSDAGGDGVLRLDVVNLGGSVDVSPGLARPAESAVHGRSAIVAGQENPFEVPVFSNGGKAPGKVEVEVREGSPTGPVVASGTVDLDAYDNAVFEFGYEPGREGGHDLFTLVDPDDTLTEGHEANNLQKASVWSAPAGPAKVLIVDDDGPGDTERAYAGALAALGIPYAVVERHVAGAEMGKYEAVIWTSTLDRNEGQLDEADRASIAEYLGGGGDLWLASNRAIEALYAGDNGAFATEWFGTGWIDIDSFYGPVGFVGDGILDGHDLTIDVLPGRPFVDKYEIAADAPGKAEPIGTLTDSGTPGDGAVLGVQYSHEKGGKSFRTVTTGFSMAQVSDPGDVVDVMSAVMEHFDVSGATPAAPKAPIVYHSQLRQTVSGVDLPVRAIVLGRGAPKVTLHYRHHSIGKYVSVPMKRSGDEGAYRAVIPAAQVTPDGIDYFITAGSTFEPRAASTGKLAHAVAVFMPEVGARSAPSDESSSGSDPAPSGALPSNGSGGAGEVVAAASGTAAAGSDRLPATGGTSLVLLGGLALAAGLGVRRLQRRAA